jgi:3-oxoacyl-[acyl-carrier-protein] synthase III
VDAASAFSTDAPQLNNSSLTPSDESIPAMPSLDRGVALLGTGRALPSRRITNHELRAYIRNYDESSGDFALWVDRVTHIQERHWVDPATESAGTMGTVAARHALEQAAVPLAEVDHLLFCSFSPTELFPGEHVRMVRDLGLSCGAFQMTAACAGSVYGLALARSLVLSGQCRNVLVVATECVSGATNFDDPLTAILFSDAAGAMVVGRPRTQDDAGFLGNAVLRTEYHPTAITMSNGNCPAPDRLLDGDWRKEKRPTLAMEGGGRVLKSAVTRMADAVVECLGFTPQDLKDDHPGLREVLNRVKLVPHQANGRIVDGLQEKLALPRANVYRTIYFLGNCSAATNAFTLDYALRVGNLDRMEPADGSGEMGRLVASDARIRKGDLVVMVSVGSGYSYGAMAWIQAY